VAQIANLVEFLRRFRDEAEIEMGVLVVEGGQRREQHTVHHAKEDELHESDQSEEDDEERLTAARADLSQMVAQPTSSQVPFAFPWHTPQTPHTAEHPPFASMQSMQQQNEQSLEMPGTPQSSVTNLSDILMDVNQRGSMSSVFGGAGSSTHAPLLMPAGSSPKEHHKSHQMRDQKTKKEAFDENDSGISDEENVLTASVAYWDPANSTPEQAKMLNKSNQELIKTLRSLGFELGTLPGSNFFVIRLNDHELNLEEINFLIAQLKKFIENREKSANDKANLKSKPVVPNTEKKVRKVHPLRRFLQHFFESKKYFVLLISFTLFVLGVSVLLKILNYFKNSVDDVDAAGRLDKAGTAFSVIYVVLVVILMLEIIMRMIIFGPLFFFDRLSGNNLFSRVNWRHIMDLLVVIAENLFTFAMIFLWLAGSSFFKSPVDNLGILLFLRVGVFMMYNKSLSGVVTGMLQSMANFGMSFVFLFMVVYMFGVISRVIFSQTCEGIYETDPLCVRFSDIFESTFSLFQVLSGDSWAENFARPGQEKLAISYIFFGLFYALTVFVLLNAVSGMVVDSIMSKAKKDEEEKRQREKEKLMEIEQNLPEVYTSNAVNGSLTGNLKTSVKNRIQSLQSQGVRTSGSAVSQSPANLDSEGNAELLAEILKRLVRIEEKINYMNHKGSL